jgi:hypothetical protein
MVRVVKPVQAREITALVREGQRLMALGSAAGDAELQAYWFRKIDILERIAAHPGANTDEVEAAEIARMASREARAVRSRRGRPPEPGPGSRSCL